jgi:DNA primase
MATDLDTAFTDIRRQLRERVRIADVLDRLGIPARISPSGAGRAFCPFHADKHRPSLSFGLKRTPDEGDIEVFHCWTCGTSGDVFTLVQLLGSYPSRTEAMRALAAEHGIPWPERGNGGSAVQRALDAAASHYAALLRGEPLAYLARRGLPEALLASMRVGYAPLSPIDGLAQTLEDSGLLAAGESCGLVQPPSQSRPRHDTFLGRIVFPDIAGGHVRCLQGRAFPERPRSPKYLTLRGARTGLYNQAAASSPSVILCEGIPDTLSVLAAGLPACGIYGTQGWKDEHSAHFARARRVYVALDRDATRRAIDIARRFGARGRVIIPPDSLGEKGDLNDWLAASGSPQAFRAALEEAMGRAPTPWELWADSLRGTPARDLHDAVDPLLRDIARLPRTLRDGILEHVSRATGMSGVSLYAAVCDIEQEDAPWPDDTASSAP